MSVAGSMTSTMGVTAPPGTKLLFRGRRPGMSLDDLLAHPCIKQMLREERIELSEQPDGDGWYTATLLSPKSGLKDEFISLSSGCGYEMRAGCVRY